MEKKRTLSPIMANYLKGMLLELHPFLTSMVHDSGKNCTFQNFQAKGPKPFQNAMFFFGTAIFIV